MKRQLSSKISNSALDKIYDDAVRCGVVGGKLLGAGGGGFYVFYVPPFRKHAVIDDLEGAGLEIRPFRFEPEGLRAWSVREGRNHLDEEDHA